jgi:CTP:molybdopterin cytidylyltransferase MocA
MSRLPQPFTADLKVLILAGSNELPSPRELEIRARRGKETPLEGKAFLRLRGRLVIEYVLDWIREAGLEQVWVLAPSECLDLIPESYRYTPIEQTPGASLATNLQEAKEVLRPADGEPTLVVFGDHPLITARALHDFLSFCGAHLHEADFFHGMATTEAYAAFSRYFQRTSVWMREASGRATGLNLVVSSGVRRVPAADHIYSVRKLEQLGQFFSMLGREIYLLGGLAPHAVLDSIRMFIAKDFEKGIRRGGRFGKFCQRRVDALRRRVPMARVESYAARLFDAERGVRVVPLAHGGTALDVDFAEEFAIIEENWDDMVELTRRQDAESEAGA